MNVRTFINKNSPEILLGLSIFGYVTSLIMTANITRRVVKYEHRVYKRPTKEKLSFYVRHYSPLGAAAVLTVSSMVGGHKISAERAATALSLMRIMQSNMDEYKTAVRARIGDKKESLIQGDASESRMRKVPLETIPVGEGQTLCFDDLTGRYFASDMETLRKAQNDFNKRIITGGGHATLNELYYEIGLSPVKLGENIGWGLGDETVEFGFDTKLSATGKPCLILRHVKMPIPLW